MGKREKRERLILAISPTARGFGFVVLEGCNRTIDWGAKEARGDKNRDVLAKAAELMSWYTPDLLVLENAEGPESRRANRIRNLHRQARGARKGAGNFCAAVRAVRDQSGVREPEGIDEVRDCAS